MLDKAQRRLDRAGVVNAGLQQGSATDLPFGDAEFDVALVAVLGEIPDPNARLEELDRVLRPGGLLSITEHLPDPDFEPFGTLRGDVEGHGFGFERRFGRAWAYTANFRKQG